MEINDWSRTANDEETVAAMRLFWERTKVIIEPSSAVPLAAILKKLSGSTESGTDKPKKIGIILSGGNVDFAKLPWTCASCVQKNNLYHDNVS